MSRFVQLHVLTSYPPSNLNRDDTGRPKTAVGGEANRLRISAQSLKRAWRTSEEFVQRLGVTREDLGKRTKRIGGKWIFEELAHAGVDGDVARSWIRDLLRAYGAPNGDKDDGSDAALETEQLVHITPIELHKLQSFVRVLSRYLMAGETSEAVSAAESAIRKRDKAKDKKAANAALSKSLAEMLLVKDSTAIDIALFGRMLAAVPSYGFDAAVQVAHAFTVHKAAVEDDYFSAVDDLNLGDEDRGAGHIGEAGFGAGVFYLYLCINCDLLVKNLGGDAALTAKSLGALVHAVTKVSPTGKQNSFASRAYAGYALAEKGDQQPRSLAQAFLKPVRGSNVLVDAAKEMTKRYENFDKIYGACADCRYTMDVEEGIGSLEDFVRFVTE